MDREIFINEVKEFTVDYINGRIENDLPIVINAMIDNVSVYVEVLNNEVGTDYNINIEELIIDLLLSHDEKIKSSEKK